MINNGKGLWHERGTIRFIFVNTFVIFMVGIMAATWNIGCRWLEYKQKTETMAIIQPRDGFWFAFRGET